VPTKSVAVLPFVNLSLDKHDEYLSDGMTEELINALARIPGLCVPGPTSCFAFKGKSEADAESGYFIAIDDRIVLLNEDKDAAAKKISSLDKPLQFEPDDVYGISNGSFEHQEGEWKTRIKLKGLLCIYEATHPSGHFKKVVWKKAVGLMEYASGYGAHADGYRLKRVVNR
jgi:hypothetical protein